MFKDCRNAKHAGVSLPQLDFGQCVSMNQAFYNSGIEKIQFAGNLDNVVSAIDAFQNCFMLEDMPNVLYKKIKHGKRLVSNFDGDYSAIFDGCDRLIRKLRSAKRDKDRQNEPGDRFDDEIARV